MFCGTSARKASHAKIIIKDNNIFNGSNNLIIGPLDKKLEIGNNNLFANHIIFRCRNDHLIYDKESLEILNIDKDVIIGDNNWICEYVTFLPKAKIKNNTVVSTGTIVNKEINESNVLLVGRPVTIKRRNINWSISSSKEKIDYDNSIKLKEE